MYFAQDLDLLELIPFIPGERVIVALLVLISSFGVFLAACILVSLLYTGTINRRPFYMYIESCALSGFILAIAVAVPSWFHLAKGGWASSSLVCQAMASIVVLHTVTFYLSLFLCLGATYSLIILGRESDLLQAKILVFGVWLVGIVMSLWYLIVPKQDRYYQISLNSSKTVCFISWPIASKYPSILLMLVLIGGIITIAIVAMCLLFFKICWFYFKSTTKNEAIDSTTTETQKSRKKTMKLTDKQRTMLYLSISAPMSILVLTLPNCFSFLFQALTQKQVSSSLDGAALLMFASFYLVMGWWCIRFESGVKTSVSTMAEDICILFHTTPPTMPHSKDNGDRPEAAKVNNPTLSVFHWSRFIEEYEVCTPATSSNPVNPLFNSDTESSIQSFEPLSDNDADDTCVVHSLTTVSSASQNFNCKINIPSIDLEKQA